MTVSLLTVTKSLEILTKTGTSLGGASNNLVEVITAQCPIGTRGADTRTILSFLLDELVGVLLIPSLLELVGMRDTMPMQTVASRWQRRVTMTACTIVVATRTLRALLEIRARGWRLDITGIGIHGHTEALLVSELSGVTALIGGRRRLRARAIGPGM
jgi:hypothetical protein